MGNLIGVDEAGRGPVIGPLVVAGVLLTSENENQELRDWGVRDSKKCTPRRRIKLAEEIRKACKYSIKITSASAIDDYRKTKNINELEGELFGEVINLLGPNEDTTVIVDSADANEDTFKRYIEAKINTSCKIISRHKADEQYPVVAAASILAKTVRDFEVEKIGKELNVELGSGYPTDPITQKFLEKWIKEKGDLPPHTRRSWKTAQRLLKDINYPVKSLDDFGD